MATVTKTHRALAVLRLPRNVSALVIFADGVVQGATGNFYFPSPTPTLAALQKAIDDLQAAEADALTRARGAVAVRNEKRQVLVTRLEEFRTYVQSTADASPENGSSIIQSSGLALRKTPVRAARGFHAKAGAVSGTVKVIAPAAARRASYEWQYSTDGTSWRSMPSTLQSRTSIAGLEPLTTVHLRYRAVIRTGEQDWSQAISFVVR